MGRSTRDPAAALDVAVPRNTIVLAASLAIIWAVVQLQATLATISVEVLTGQTALAGLGAAVFLVATALATAPAGQLMDRVGRIPVLSGGFVLASLACAVLFAAISAGSIVALWVGLAALGAGFGAVNLARAAAADMYPPARRASGIGRVLLGSAAGAIGGPIIFAPLLQGRDAVASSLAAPWVVAAAITALGAGLVWAMRVDPLEIGRRLSQWEPGDDGLDGERSWPTGWHGKGRRPLTLVFSSPSTRAALIGVVAAQTVMTTAMALIGLHMRHTGHDLGAISIALGGHFVGMFALSPLLGRAVDLGGRRRALVAGLIVLAGGCAGLLLSDALWSLVPSMFFVGVGWNVASLAGTALIADATEAHERAAALGAADLASLLAAAAGSIVASVLLGAAGLLPVVLLAIAVAVVPAFFIERERPILATTG
jgi:MFS family permease